MKLGKAITAFCIVFYLLISVPPCQGASGNAPAISAKAAVLMDFDTGKVIYGKDMDSVRAPASLTKIMTALIALRSDKLMERVAVSDRAVQAGGASFGLKVGDQPPLWKLLYGMMLKSGNDAAVAVAEGVAGSENAFVKMMNEEAAVMGLRKTHFANPNGLPAENHYSTAKELAILTRAALKNQLFNKIVGTRVKNLSWYGRAREVQNINKFLWRYDGANGVKTGYTSAAGYCLAASATSSSGRRFIAVILGSSSSDNRWSDAAALMDWAMDFTSKNTYTVKAGDTLSEIAASFRVTTSALQRANNLKNRDIIKTGMSLVIP